MPHAPFIPPVEELRLSKGTFVVSIDFELTWGLWDYADLAAEKLVVAKERMVVTRLLELFDRYDIRTTWATVGALFDKIPPEKKLIDAWYAPELVEKIRDNRVDHELATHTYAHVYFQEIPSQEAAADLSQARQVHAESQYPFASIVFPRNQVAHLDVIANSGLRVFRSVDAGLLGWSIYRAPRLRPVLNLAGKMVPSPAPTVLPRRHGNGLIELPSSMLLLGRNGIRKVIRPAVMVTKIRSSLAVAAARRRMFHLWFHPSNFYHDTDTQFAILERGLRTAAKMRDRGYIDIRTMGDFANEAA